jgi:DNA-binding MarR family transcriptional regulator
MTNVPVNHTTEEETTVLAFLRANPEANFYDIANLLSMSLGYTVRLLSSMASKGLVSQGEPK